MTLSIYLFIHLSLYSLQLQRLGAQSVTVTEEENALAFTNGTLRRLNPLAPASTSPHTLQESERSPTNIRAVVTTHDWLDGFGSFIGVVEGDGTDVMVKNVGLDDTVEKSAADESEFTIDRSGGTTNVVPALTTVVRKSWVSVLKVGDSN
jgi:hypothetical protein